MFCLCDPHPAAYAATVSLRLGHGAALAAHRAVIHNRAAASLPRGKVKDATDLRVPLTIHNYHNYYITNDSDAHA